MKTFGLNRAQLISLINFSKLYIKSQKIEHCYLNAVTTYRLEKTLLIALIIFFLENGLSDIIKFLCKHILCFFDPINKIFNEKHQRFYLWVILKTKKFV